MGNDVVIFFCIVVSWKGDALDEKTPLLRSMVSGRNRKREKLFEFLNAG